MFIGPSVNSLSFNFYIFAATRALVRAEALITELVFEHSLRIRLVAETSKENKPENDQDSPTVVGTPETASVAESSQTAGGEADAEEESSATAASDKGKAKQSPTLTSKAPPAKKDIPSKKDTNLIGKINNLVTTDLGNITDARDFLMLSSSFSLARELLTRALYLVLSVPLQICACTIFLYQILGWRCVLQVYRVTIVHSDQPKRICRSRVHCRPASDSRIYCKNATVSPTEQNENGEQTVDPLLVLPT